MEYLIGLQTGIALILAIGAQNAFVLKQGLLRQHVFVVVAICALSDAILIAAGVAGMGALTATFPWVIEALRWGGVAFLTWYGARSFVSAWRGGEAMVAAGDGRQSLRRIVLTLLAFTWLNPHVYIDTVVLIGSLSAQYPGREWVFGAGAMTGSLVFFASLGYGARLLAPIFERPISWQILDVIIGVVMWTIALTLVFG
jgi:L-lysine exporter family protein LysE/ArgO